MEKGIKVWVGYNKKINVNEFGIKCLVLYRSAINWINVIEVEAESISERIDKQYDIFKKQFKVDSMELNHLAICNCLHNKDGLTTQDILKAKAIIDKCEKAFGFNKKPEYLALFGGK